jgi:hypothetical protein
MANGMRELLLRRENWEALVANPALIPNAIEEVLRFSPSIVAWRRRALKDATIGGVPVPKDSNILLLIGSANRDESVFAEPSRFNVQRTDARSHLAFGYGIHACVGQQLGRIEFAIALGELTRRLPSLRLAADQSFDFIHNISFRVPTSLRIEWDVA